MLAYKSLQRVFRHIRPSILHQSFLRPCRAGIATTQPCLAGVNPIDEAIYTSDHWEMRQSLNKLIEKEINPYVDEWEQAKTFPAHSVIKKLGDGGFLGPTRDPEYGGLGLDYTFSVAIAEELGSIRCGGVPMAIGVHSGKSYKGLSMWHMCLGVGDHIINYGCGFMLLDSLDD